MDSSRNRHAGEKQQDGNLQAVWSKRAQQWFRFTRLPPFSSAQAVLVRWRQGAHYGHC